MVPFDPTTPVETWHPIPSLPGYELSNRLTVRRHVSSVCRRPLASGPRPVSVHVRPRTAYRYFNTGDGLCYLHRAIWEVANGRAVPDGMMVRHRDDDRTNNRPDNLTLGTHGDNVDDARRNGRYRGARDTTTAGLNAELVREARRLFDGGVRLPALARRYGVHYTTIRNAVRRVTWADVTE
jgi:hypothetical protein